jgi:hypothetical protein
MTISRVKPSNWQINEKLTSTQINALDTNVTYALDKRSGQSDTLQSDVTVGTGGVINVQLNGELSTANDATVDLNIGEYGSIEVIDDGYLGVTQGATVNMRLGAFSTIHAADTGAIIKASGGGLIRSDAVGSIVLNGGSSDWVKFGSARTRTIAFHWNPEAHKRSTGWKDGGSFPFYLESTATGDTGIFVIPRHPGALLASVKVYYQIQASHFPGTRLTFSLHRQATSGSSSSLQSFGGTFANGANATDYYAAGAIQSVTVTADQNNTSVADTTHTYYLKVVEESGVSSSAGNKLWGFEVNYTDINYHQFT